MLSELAANEQIVRPPEADVSRLYSPAGLDIGSNSSADVALSIVAEMRAVLEGRLAGMLRERRGSIHGSNVHVERAPVIEQLALISDSASGVNVTFTPPEALPQTFC